MESQQSPLTLLNAVQGVNAMPFHNLQLLATQTSNCQGGKDCNVEGRRWLAGHLLEALGYKVDILAARVTHPGNHVVILVHDVVERGNSFLVEVGSGYSSTTAVPITNGSFEHHFRESFLEFRYIKTEGVSLIRREHRGGDPSRPVLCDSLGLVRLRVGDDTLISFGHRVEVWNSFHRGWWMFAHYQMLHHSWQVFGQWDGSMGRWLQWKMGTFLKRKMEKSKSQLSKAPRRSSRSSQNIFLKLIDPQLMQPLNTGEPSYPKVCASRPRLGIW